MQGDAKGGAEVLLPRLEMTKTADGEPCIPTEDHHNDRVRLDGSRAPRVYLLLLTEPLSFPRQEDPEHRWQVDLGRVVRPVRAPQRPPILGSRGELEGAAARVSAAVVAVGEQEAPSAEIAVRRD
jgi:hypothetical protein